MKLSLTTVAACAALTTQFAPAAADPIREVAVRSHPSQGEVSQIDGASARLVVGEAGVFVRCSIPDDHIDPRRSAFFMARSVLGDIREHVQC